MYEQKYQQFTGIMPYHDDVLDYTSNYFVKPTFNTQ